MVVIHDGLNLSWQSNRTSREDLAKEDVSFLTRAHVEAQACVIVMIAWQLVADSLIIIIVLCLLSKIS